MAGSTPIPMAELTEKVAEAIDADVRLLLLATNTTLSQFEEHHPEVLRALSSKAAAVGHRALREAEATSREQFALELEAMADTLSRDTSRSAVAFLKAAAVARRA